MVVAQANVQVLSKVFDFEDATAQLGYVRFTDGEIKVLVIEANIDEEQSDSCTNPVVLHTIMTNRCGSIIHFDKYFLIDSVLNREIIHNLIEADIVAETRSVVFTKNGAVSTYRLCG